MNKANYKRIKEKSDRTKSTNPSQNAALTKEDSLWSHNLAKTEFYDIHSPYSLGPYIN